MTEGHGKGEHSEVEKTGKGGQVGGADEGTWASGPLSPVAALPVVPPPFLLSYLPQIFLPFLISSMA